MRVLHLAYSGIVGVLAALIFGSLGVYIQWTAWVLALGALLIGCVAGWCAWRYDRPSPEALEHPSAMLGRSWVGAITLLYAVIFAVYSLSRSEESLISPWQAVTVAVVPLFALVSLTAWRSLPLVSRWAAGWITALQGLAAFGLSLVVYRFGFGFDPFIHQAATRYLAGHGEMTLTTPLYVGYYTVIAAFHRLTTISVDWLDRAIVPLAMTVFFAWWTVRGTELWKLPRWTGWMILLIPYAFATFSVPYHLALVCLLWVMALLPSWERGSRRFASVLLGVYSALVHPLVAAPLFFFLAAEFLRGKMRTYSRVPLVGLGTFFGIVALFWMYVTQGGGSWQFPTGESLLVGMRVLTGLPYLQEAMPPWMWYVWNGQYVWMGIVVLIGALGWTVLAPKEARARGFDALAITIGTGLAALVVASSASFTNILPGEQYEFALRLRNILPWLLFPGCAYAMVWIADRRWGRWLGCALVPILLTANWLASYPPNAPEMRFVAPGLGAQEIRAFEAAELLADARPYAALTPHMVSAASLKRVGFDRALQTQAGERYPYAIPTGGELYGFYLQLWTERDPGDLLKETCVFARVPQVIVILPFAWDPNHWIDARLTPLTTRWTTTDLRHRLYRYSCTDAS